MGSKIKVGIIGAAGYTAGELMRILKGHPYAEITFAQSGSNAGNPVWQVHQDLVGETDMKFCEDADLDCVPVTANRSRMYIRCRIHIEEKSLT